MASIVSMCAKPISIHALRVEGDIIEKTICHQQGEFLSTPSGWRATQGLASKIAKTADFYPRPPGGGRLDAETQNAYSGLISIHALRVEGDRVHTAIRSHPPISIHALRVEGDSCKISAVVSSEISIHALRVEGDRKLTMF